MYRNSYLELAARKIDKYAAKYGSTPWKANLRFLLWSLAQPFLFRRRMRPKSDGICRIAFELRGGVGDIILSLNFLQNFSRFLDTEHIIDLYIPAKRGLRDAARILCREQNFVREIGLAARLSRDYDILVELLRCPDLLYVNRPKIEKLSPKLLAWCDVNNSFHQENPLAYRYGTPGDYLGSRLAMLQGRTRLQQADIGNLIGVESTFRPKIFLDKRETPAKFGLADGPFVTLQRGVGGGDQNVSTKLWPSEHYDALVGLIRKRWPDLRTVQIGTERNLPIKGVDVDLRGRTTFEEVMVLMASSRCHIDGECGMVHLRHFLGGGPSVVLFGLTDEHFFGYPENANLRSAACPGGCEWITTTAMQKCPRGFERNECLVQLRPETVLEAVAKILDNDAAG